MKKLMIAAVAGVLAVAANAETFNKCGETFACPFGYQIKIFVKTTGSAAAKADCGDACVRVPATRRLAGFVYGATAFGGDGGQGPCGETNTVCSCNMWNEGELLLWNYDTKAEAMPKTAKIVQLDRIYTGDTTTIEMAVKFEGWGYDFNLAGFGRVAGRNGLPTIKFAQGFCAGVIPAPTCQADRCSQKAIAAAWTICQKPSEAPVFAPETTAAYGKWTLDWSATVYNRYASGMTLIPGKNWEEMKEIPFNVK